MISKQDRPGRLHGGIPTPMLKSCWVVVAIAGLALSYPVGERAHAQRGTPQGKTRSGEQAPSRTVGSAESSLARIARVLESTQTGPEAEAAEKRANRDLNAQEDMARFALWMFFATAATTLLTMVGVLLIWRTLIHTRRAAKYAGVAARQARRAAASSDRMADEAAKGTAAAVQASDAGREANQIARDAAEASERFARENLMIARGTASVTKEAAQIQKRVERAYLATHLTKESVKFSSLQSAAILPRISNAGKTPGEITSLCCNFHLALPSKVAFDDSKLVNYPNLIVAADSHMEMELLEIPEGMSQFFFTGYFTYNDLFGDSHFNRFCYFFDLGEGSFRPAGSYEWHKWD